MRDSQSYESYNSRKETPMPDLTTSQRAELIDLIKAIYSHEGERTQLLPTGCGCHHECANPMCPVDLQAFVGVWVPWLVKLGWEPFLPSNGFAWHKRYTTDEEEQDITFCGVCYSHIKHKLAVVDPNFILATARAVRAQQTGGA